MKQLSVIGIVLVFLFKAEMHSYAQQTVHLVPNPQQIAYINGSFRLQGPFDAELYLNDKEEEYFIFEQLRTEMERSVGQEITLRASTHNALKIVVGIKGGSRFFNRLIQEHNLEPGEELGREGYRLKVTPGLILISANTKTGAFYGVQTLKQLIRSQRTQGEIPALEIKDWPDFEIRGMMDDISRGPVPNLAYMKQQIERMAELKVNMLTYYVQDVVKTKSHPAFAPPGGAITIEEWKKLADYARKFHIDLVGNFQSFGHFENILKHPEYAHLGESGTLLSPALEESYQLLEDIYSEMIPAFHSNYFHINSDETFDLGTGPSKAMVDSLGEAAVYAQHINRIHNIITKKGKKVMMWADIALKHPEILDRLPDDIVMISWNYDALDDFAPLISPVENAGYDMLVSTGVLNSFTLIPDFNIAKANIAGFLAEAKQHNVKGMLHTVWDDGGFAFFSNDWYGVAYAADQSWNSQPEDQTYETRFNRAIYGSSSNGYTMAIQMLNKLAGLKSTEKMNSDVFWEKIIPDKGKETLMNVQDWPQVLEWVDSAETALASAPLFVYKQDKEYLQYIIDIYRFLATSRPALLEASTAYKHAIEIQNEDREQARRYVGKAFRLFTEISRELTALREDLRHLWVAENRVYALDRIEEKMDRQLADVKQVEDGLLEAMFEFDKGNALPSAGDLRLDIQASEGWYFQGWLMIEPIPNPQGAVAPPVDHLEDMGGIESTFPNVTEEFYFQNKKYRWKRVNTPYFAKVDLDELFGVNENVIMYAFAHIDAPDTRSVRALVGSSDGIEVFINGRHVYQNFTEREFQVDQDEFFLPLHEGRNHLMLKITNRTGDWAFSFRLPDSNVRSHKNRYKIIE